MFRLPNDSFSANRLKSFNSYFFSNHIYSKRQSQSLILQRRSSSVLSSNNQIERKNKIRPQTSLQRNQSARISSKSSMEKSGIKLDSEGLMSPSNRKLRFFSSEQSQNNIDKKMESSNFLLQPCKIESLVIRPRKYQIKGPAVQKYNSCYTQKIKLATQNNNKLSMKSKPAIRQYTRHQQLRKDEQIEPWDSSDCYFESIKLNPKFN